METALVLGATSDIGIAIAKKFAAAGYNIQLAARKPEQLDAIKSDIEIRHRVSCSTHAFDALRYDSHAAFFDSLRPDITITVFGTMYEEDDAFNDWALAVSLFCTNYTGAVLFLFFVVFLF